jgi:uncharacterized membrane protein
MFWIGFSGVIWFVVGVFLLFLGVKLVVFSIEEGAAHSPLLSKLYAIFKSREYAALILVTGGLFLGFIKGRFVLSKTARRVVDRICALSDPIRFFDVYSGWYLALIACMMLLGMGLRWMHVPSDLRGSIDIAVGSALMNGAMFYFRAILKKRKEYL